MQKPIRIKNVFFNHGPSLAHRNHGTGVLGHGRPKLQPWSSRFRDWVWFESLSKTRIPYAGYHNDETASVATFSSLNTKRPSMPYNCSKCDPPSVIIAIFLHCRISFTILIHLFFFVIIIIIPPSLLTRSAGSWTLSIIH